MEYRGIHFTVRPRGDSSWAWEIHPPVSSVIGWKVARGEVTGRMADAMRAARDEIDRQWGTPVQPRTPLMPDELRDGA